MKTFWRWVEVESIINFRHSWALKCFSILIPEINSHFLYPTVKIKFFFISLSCVFLLSYIFFVNNARHHKGDISILTWVLQTIKIIFLVAFVFVRIFYHFSRDENRQQKGKCQISDDEVEVNEESQTRKLYYASCGTTNKINHIFMTPRVHLTSHIELLTQRKAQQSSAKKMKTPKKQKNNKTKLGKYIKFQLGHVFSLPLVLFSTFSFTTTQQQQHIKHNFYFA